MTYHRMDFADGGDEGEEEEDAADERERRTWVDRKWHCQHNLLQWGVLFEGITNKNVRAHDELQAQEGDGETQDSQGVDGEGLWRAVLDKHNRARFMPHLSAALAHMGACSPDGPALVEGFLGELHSGNQLDARAWVEGVPAQCADVATCFAAAGQWSQVKQYVRKGMDATLRQWSALHACAGQARRHLLAPLQRFTELGDACVLQQGAAGAAERDKDAGVTRLLRRWQYSLPAAADPTPVWAGVGRARQLALASTVLGLASPMRDAALTHLAALHEDAASAAVYKGVLEVCASELVASEVLNNDINGRAAAPALNMQSIRAAVLRNASKASTIKEQGGAAADISHVYNQTLLWLDSRLAQIDENDAALTLDRLELVLVQGDMHSRWAEHQRSTACDVHSENIKWRQRANLAARSFNLVTGGPVATGAVAVPTSGSDSRRGGLRRQAYDMAAALHDDLLTHAPSASTKEAREGTAAELVGSLCAGLALGSKHCRDRVLRLFKVLATCAPGGKATATAQTGLAAVPVWTFIGYAPQLVSMLEDFQGGQGGLLLATLRRVAAQYPRALYWPLHVTVPCLSAPVRARLLPLLDGVADPAMAALTKALGNLTHPELRAMDGIKQLTVDLKNMALAYRAKDNAQLEEAQEDALRTYRRIMADVLSSTHAHVGPKIGSYNAAFCLAWKRQFTSVLGDKGDKINTANLKKLYPDGIVKLRDALDTHIKTHKMLHVSGRVKLELFSNWLADFDPAVHELEVPGQYSGAFDCEPQPEMHSMVVSVDPQLLVMSSVRKPKRVLMYGSDGSEHLFLVKGGEDLRNDERIERVFDLMNSIVGADAGAGTGVCVSVGVGAGVGSADPPRRANVRVRTYKVLPVSVSVGLLEWVADTATLNGLVGQQMAADETFAHANKKSGCWPSGGGGGGRGANSAAALPTGPLDPMYIEATHTREKWLATTSKTTCKYMLAYANKSAADALNVWTQMQAQVPNHFLRRAVLRMAASSEAFLTMRQELATTLAAACVFGYVLGLGDRHGENILVHTPSGAIVPIDFGVCFGMGATVLGVPELIPFRLTPQLLGLLQPMKGTSLLRRFMVQAMRALRSRDGAALLGVVLAAYVDDPIIDWLKDKHRSARSSTEGDGDGNGATTAESYQPANSASASSSSRAAAAPRLQDDAARKKVQSSRRKLAGEHPVKLLLEEVMSNRTVAANKAYPFIEKVCTGSEYPLKASTRTLSEAAKEAAAAGVAPSKPHYQAMRDRDPTLTPEAQVDVLLAVATDPNVLVRQWVGLKPWV